MVQTGDGARQTKVFKALAAPHGLCENLINAIKLLTIQQKDGDSLFLGNYGGLEKLY